MKTKKKPNPKLIDMSGFDSTTLERIVQAAKPVNKLAVRLRNTSLLLLALVCLWASFEAGKHSVNCPDTGATIFHER